MGRGSIPVRLHHTPDHSRAHPEVYFKLRGQPTEKWAGEVCYYPRDNRYSSPLSIIFRMSVVWYGMGLVGGELTLAAPLTAPFAASTAALSALPMLGEC